MAIFEDPTQCLERPQSWRKERLAAVVQLGPIAADPGAVPDLSRAPLGPTRFRLASTLRGFHDAQIPLSPQP